MHHALVQRAVTDLKRKSIVGGAAVTAQGAKVCGADGDDDGVGAIVITGGFWIAGNDGRDDRFSRAFQTGRLNTTAKIWTKECSAILLLADLFPVGAQTGRQRSAHSF